MAPTLRHERQEFGGSHGTETFGPAKNKAAPAAASDEKAAVPATIADNTIVVGKSHKYEVLDLRFGNRHGLVTGATGTGKTVTLQVLAEGFSRAGVPVFAADIKGDLSGIAVL